MVSFWESAFGFLVPPFGGGVSQTQGEEPKFGVSQELLEGSRNDTNDILLTDSNQRKRVFVNREQYKRLFGKYPDSDDAMVIMTESKWAKVHQNIHSSDWASLSTWVKNNSSIQPITGHQATQTIDKTKTKTVAGAKVYYDSDGNVLDISEFDERGIVFHWKYRNEQLHWVQPHGISFEAYFQTVENDDGESTQRILRTATGNWIPAWYVTWDENTRKFGHTVIHQPAADTLPTNLRKYYVKIDLPYNNYIPGLPAIKAHFQYLIPKFNGVYTEG